jgi:hypothetical protein
VNQPEHVVVTDGSRQCPANSGPQTVLPLCAVGDSQEPGRWIYTQQAETYCETTGRMPVYDSSCS